MATLFLGRRHGAAGFQRPVAIKLVHPHLAADSQFRQMLVDEAMVSARINHPNVVHVEELGQFKDTYFLVMEYVQGSSLGQVLRELSKRKLRLLPEVAVWIAIGILDGLHAAHETLGDDGKPLNIVHRDVTPENILVGFKGHVKVIDFGIAKARDNVIQTAAGTLKGKFAYMAPEQARGQAVDRRTDVYTAGIVLWEMLTMRRCFPGANELSVLEKVRDPKVEPPSAYVQDIPANLEAALMKALSPKAKDRPATAQAFRRLLAEALPKALTLDSSHLSDLLGSVMADEKQRQREALPEEVLTPSRGAANPEALHTLTVESSQVSLDKPATSSVSRRSPETIPRSGAERPRPTPPPAALGANTNPGGAQPSGELDTQGGLLPETLPLEERGETLRLDSSSFASVSPHQRQVEPLRSFSEGPTSVETPQTEATNVRDKAELGATAVKSRWTSIGRGQKVAIGVAAVMVLALTGFLIGRLVLDPIEEPIAADEPQLKFVGSSPLDVTADDVAEPNPDDMAANDKPSGNEAASDTAANNDTAAKDIVLNNGSEHGANDPLANKGDDDDRKALINSDKSLAGRPSSGEPSVDKPTVEEPVVVEDLRELTGTRDEARSKTKNRDVGTKTTAKASNTSNTKPSNTKETGTKHVATQTVKPKRNRPSVSRSNERKPRKPRRNNSKTTIVEEVPF